MCHLGIRGGQMAAWERLRQMAAAQGVPESRGVREALADAAVELVRGTARAYVFGRLPEDVSASERELVLDRLLPPEFLAGLRGELLELVVVAMARAKRGEYACAFSDPVGVMRRAEAFAGVRNAARALTVAAISAARAKIATGFAHPRPKTVAGAVRLASIALSLDV